MTNFMLENNYRYMKNCCDLHLHSYFSDGTCSPADVVASAVKLGLSAIALTDHNTVKGLPEFLSEAEKKGIDAMAGIEFSVDYLGKELHLLALCVNEEYYGEIEEKMDYYLSLREKSNKAMVSALRETGYMIDYDTIYKKSGNGYINRAHIASELVEKGYSPSIREAFKTFLNKDGPYFRPREFPNVFDMIDYIGKIGAVSVLAHPFLQFDETGLREFLTEAKKHGLDGMETVYTEFDGDQTALLRSMAREFDMLDSGGSDFHGATKPDVALGKGFGDLKVPAAFAEIIKERYKKKHDTSYHHPTRVQ